MRRRWLTIALGAAAVLVVLVAGFLAWQAFAPRVHNQMVIQNASGQTLDRVLVRFGGQEAEVRGLPAGVTATIPAPLGAEGDVQAEAWYADGRTAQTELGGPGVGRRFGWRWEFVVSPPGPAPGGISGRYAPRPDR